MLYTNTLRGHSERRQTVNASKGPCCEEADLLNSELIHLT